MIAFRHAVPADASAIAAVHSEAHRAAYAPLLGDAYQPRPPETLQTLWAGVLAQGQAVWLAEAPSGLVGFGHAVDDRLTTLYLLPSHHRQGIGRRLLALLLADARERGEVELRFEVLAGNSGAAAFYEAQGAQRRGEQPREGRPPQWLYRIPTAPAG